MIPEQVEKSRPIRWIDILRYLNMVQYPITAREVEAYLNPVSHEASNARTRLLELAQAGLVQTYAPDDSDRYSKYILTGAGLKILHLPDDAQSSVLKTLRRTRRDLERRRSKHLTRVKRDWVEAFCRTTTQEVQQALELLR